MAENFYVELLHNLTANLAIAIDQVKGGETKETDGIEFNAEDFWNRLGLVFKAIAHEATKLSLTFSSPPLPSSQECESLITGVEKTTLALVSLYYCLPKSQGFRLRKSTQNAVVDVIQGITDLAKAVEQYGCGSSEQLQSTGNVWNGADIFPQIPKDNREAVLKVICEAQGMATDALQEIQEAVDSGGIGDDLDELLDEDVGSDNENTWSERDKTLLGPCLGLLKASKSLLKKTKDTVKKNAFCNSEQTVMQLDDLADLVDRLSPAVDELASSLYPPIHYQTLNENGKCVYQIHGTMLEFIRKCDFVTENDQQWIDFLHKANQHNWENINTHLNEVS
ncbi:cyclin-D1-binding protein 1 homolog [Mytilus edulis]|uniref:cyclin-D1-binding protein 1 homolog n=1 Tax=Mytilus edulis TaxID=6550 RepID=UPI0039F090F1